MGPATLTADQMAGWVRSQGFSPRIEADLTELAQIFIDEGNDEGVRGDFAFAQSVIETGGFESAPGQQLLGHRLVRHVRGRATGSPTPGRGCARRSSCS